MAKTARKNRTRNARRARRKLAKAMRGEGDAPKGRSALVLGMILRCKAQRFPDRRKAANKKACRGTVDHG